MDCLSDISNNITVTECIPVILNKINGFVWGPVTLILLVGTGLFLMIGLHFMPLRRIGLAFKLLWQGRKGDHDEGEISPFNALMTALSATVGTGNIVGVAGAIAIGGPGAIFWMWITALVGMATKYAEAVLAVKYREVDEAGNHQGGPMYYIKNGLGKNWTWLAFLFATFGAFAAFGIGNGVQSNAVANALYQGFEIPNWITAIVLSILTGLVLLGGITRIGKLAGKLVPIMAIFYVGGAMIIILMNLSSVPDAIWLIIKEAFSPSAAAGGAVGAAIMLAIQKGVARGVFSNEAGLGTAPIAHAAAKTNDPVKQGTIGMLGTFIDTIIICTMTAIVIILMNGWTTIDIETGKTVLTNAWTQLDPLTGETISHASITANAFSLGLPAFGKYIVTLGLAFFAYTTILGWSFYGERCAEYLFGIRVIPVYRVLWILVVLISPLVELKTIWIVAEILNGLMAIPNLIGLLLLSPIVFKITREHYAK